MPRHNRKESEGIADFFSIVTKHSEWIYQGAPRIDAGVDVIIEQTIDDDPNGALIVCQIKSGNSNFTSTKDGKLVHYISNVHHEYWTNHDLPVILILVDDNGIIYWGLLNHNTIKETKMRFKTEISKNQKLLPENINDVFERVVHTKNPRNLVADSGDTDFLLDEIMNITIVTDSLSSMGNAYKASIKNLSDIRKKVNTILESEINTRTKKLLNNQFNRAATQNNILAERLKSEIKILASGFASSSHALRKYLNTVECTKDYEPAFSKWMRNLSDFDDRLSDYIEAFQIHIKTFETFKDNNKKHKKAKEYLNSVMGLFIKEMKDMKLMINKILHMMKSKIVA